MKTDNIKIVMPDVEIIKQTPGIIGMYKHAERVGRISYKSEDRITDTSYEKFLKMIHDRGHWTVLEHGSVYLKFPKDNVELLNIFKEAEKTTKTIIKEDTDFIYISTNYRVICQYKLQEEMEKYWSEPGENHVERITTHWITSRGVSHELVRHRSMVFIQESQRYVAYDKDRFGSAIQMILPQWIYKVRERIASTVDSATGDSREWVRDLDGEELWNHLTCEDRTVASRDDMWRRIADEYMWERSTEESETLKPEEARGILCNDTKTELCMTGFVTDYTMEPSEDSPEKIGFLYLRSASDAHPDVRVLAQRLKEMFIDNGYYK